MTQLERQADLLDAYWTDLSRDAASASPADLDPAMVSLARQVAQYQRRLEPDDAFLVGLGRQLAVAGAAQVTGQRTGETGHVVTTAPSTRRPRAARFRMRGRITSLVAAVLLALGGAIGYLRWQAPTAVSAQTVLRRAVAALPDAGPQQVIHIVDRRYYTESRPGPRGPRTYVMEGTSDLWVQQDAHGLVTRLDWTERLTETGVRGVRVIHTVAAGLTRAVYDSEGRAATITTGIPPTAPERRADPHVPDWVGMLRAAQQGTAGNVHLLGQQMVAGARVYAVSYTFPHAAGVTITYYIDAHSYDLRALDATTIDVSGHLVSSQTVRVIQYTAVPLSAVPARVFTFTPPPGTTVHTHRYRAGEQQVVPS